MMGILTADRRVVAMVVLTVYQKVAMMVEQLVVGMA